MAYLYRVDNCRVCEIQEEVEGSFEELKTLVKEDEEEVLKELMEDGFGRNDFNEMYSKINKPGLYVFAADDGTTLVTEQKINNDEEMEAFLDKIWDEEFAE